MILNIFVLSIYTGVCRQEIPGADVLKSFGKGIHKYIGLEVRNCIKHVLSISMCRVMHHTNKT